MLGLNGSPEVRVQNRAAAYYEQRYQGYGRRYHAEIVQWMTRGFQGRILDAGCGTGFVSQVRADLDLVGVDCSPGMLARYQGRCGYQMDVTRLPSTWTGTFDGVVCRSLLHHVPDHYAGLAELHRVLKSGAPISMWETNQSWLAERIRRRTQHGDRFSEYHHSFQADNLLRDIRKWFVIDQVRYLGFLGYPLWGFPDIVDLQRWIPMKRWIYAATMALDRGLEQAPLVKYWSWSLGVRAHKR